MSIYDKASLVLIPSGSKTSKVYSQKPTNGDGDFTFSRSTAATRVNASGNIEKETMNLLFPSEGTTTGWSASGIGTNTSTILTGQQDPNGGTQGYRWTAICGATTSDRAWYRKNITAGGEVYTLSFWVKSATGSDQNVGFHFSGGTGTPLTATSSWQRVQYYGVAGVGSSYYGIEIRGTLTDQSADVYIYGMQLEYGLVARDYIETTTTAIYGGITDNVPRLDYTDSSCPALLLEPQRTNNITQSEYVDSWGVKTNISVVSNDGTSPEGVINASNIYPTTTGACFLYEGSITYTSGTTYTYSVFAKANGKDYLQITTSGASFSNQYCTFDLALGSTDNNGFESVGIEDYGNGWYRCYVVETAISTASSRFVIGLVSNANAGRLSSITPSGTNGVLIYGVVSEAGSYATSYIPTYGSAVTRAYENQDATGLSTSVFNNDDLTLFYDFDYNADGREGSTTAYRIFSGTSQLGIKGRSGSSRSVEIYSSGSFSGSIVFNNIANSSRIKVALRITNGTCELFFNGAKDTETIDVSGAAPYNWGQITMLASSSLNTSLNQCLGFPTALTDQELIDLTTL